MTDPLIDDVKALLDKEKGDERILKQIYRACENNEVISNCILALQNHFNIDKWQINQPILLRTLYVALDAIQGVQTVKSIEIINKTNSANGYSDYAYDIPGATANNVVYPSLDPMIFELKYPNSDIQGKVVPL